jgi:hypothetical protein
LYLQGNSVTYAGGNWILRREQYSAAVLAECLSAAGALGNLLRLAGALEKGNN